jgi:hypothetical protein
VRQSATIETILGIRSVSRALLLAVATCTVGCDLGYSVDVENRTGARVTYFVEGVNARPGSAMAEGTTLAHTEGHVSHWLVPSGSRDSRQATVRAVAVSGGQIYCHRFGWEELSRIRFRIELKAGVSDCS